MAVYPTWDVQMAFDSGGTVWTSVKSSVLDAGGVSAFWGNRSSGPDIRVAETGQLAMQLDNSASHGGTVGQYSPSHASVRSGFGIGTPTRIKLVDPTTGGTAYKKFYMTDIDPKPGIYGSHVVDVAAEDYMGKMAVQFATNLSVLTSTRVDLAMGTLIATMPVAPAHTSYATAPDTLDYVYHDIDSQKSTVMNAGQRLVQSDLGYWFCDVDSTAGETLKYQTRHTRLTNTSRITFANTMKAEGLSAPRRLRNQSNDITVVVTPVSLGASNETMYATPREIEIGPGKSVTFKARYRDPNSQAENIRLRPGTQVTPVADTDYKMSSVSGDSGNDKNANLTISLSWYADYADCTLTNSGTSTGYVNTFNLRGKIIRIYDKRESTKKDTSANLAKYGRRPLRFTLPYIQNANTAQDFADFLFNRYAAPATQTEYVEFDANVTAAKLTAAITCCIGDRITVQETVTGLSEDFNIVGIEWLITPSSNALRVKWYLEPATGGALWFLGTSGLSELGTTTYLGF